MARQIELSQRIDAEARAKIFAALSDPTRLRMIDLLLSSSREICGSEMAEKLCISMANLCHHWKVLVEAGLITKQRDGQSKYCSLNRDFLSENLRKLLP